MAVQQRYVMTFLGFFFSVITGLVKFSIGIVITEMVVQQKVATRASWDTCPFTPSNSTQASTHGKAAQFDWSEETQGLILGAFYWSYPVMQVPWGVLAGRVGSRWVLGAAALLANLSQLFTPPAVQHLGALGLVLMRVTAGVAIAAVYPCLNLILVKWAPPLEKTTLCAIMYVGEEIGVIMSMAVSGVILGHWGWPLLFYVYGALGMVCLALWLCLGYDSPLVHPFISEEEKLYLKDVMPRNTEDKPRSTPWSRMMRSPPLWALMFGFLGFDWASITIITQLPRYMKTVLHYEVEADGFLSAIPYVSLVLVSLFSGRLCDWLLEKKYLSVTAVRKLYNTIYSAGYAVGVLGSILAGCDRLLVVIMFTFGVSTMAFFFGSLAANTSDLSPAHAGTIMGIVGCSQYAGMLSSYLTGVIAPQGTMTEWRKVFLIAIAFCVICNVFYLVAGSGDVQPWDNHESLEERCEEANTPEYTHDGIGSKRMKDRRSEA